MYLLESRKALVVITFGEIIQLKQKLVYERVHVPR